MILHPVHYITYIVPRKHFFRFSRIFFSPFNFEVVFVLLFLLSTAVIQIVTVVKKVTVNDMFKFLIYYHEIRSTRYCMEKMYDKHDDKSCSTMLNIISY